MKGSEYIAARIAITALGLITAMALIVATALWGIPAMIRGISFLVPVAFPSIAGAMIGLAGIMTISLFIHRVLGYCLAQFEAWVIRKGGIED